VPGTIALGHNQSLGEQMICPNPSVRCNIGAAVITRNWNIQFRSEWKMDKVMVNGEMWEVCVLVLSLVLVCVCERERE
jgi:hypothetical protein